MVDQQFVSGGTLEQSIFVVCGGNSFPLHFVEGRDIYAEGTVDLGYVKCCVQEMI